MNRSRKKLTPLFSAARRLLALHDDEIQTTLRRREVDELLGNDLGRAEVLEEDGAGCARAHPTLLRTDGHGDDGLGFACLYGLLVRAAREKGGKYYIV